MYSSGIEDAYLSTSEVEKSRTLLESSRDAFKLSTDRKLYKSEFSPLSRKAAGTLYPKVYAGRTPPGPCCRSTDVVVGTPHVHEQMFSG